MSLRLLGASKQPRLATRHTLTTSYVLRGAYKHLPIHEEWAATAKKAMKGKDPNKLIWRTQSPSTRVLIELVTKINPLSNPVNIRALVDHIQRRAHKGHRPFGSTPVFRLWKARTSFIRTTSKLANKVFQLLSIWRCTEGVAVDSIEGMKRLFDGVPPDKMSVSITMNGAVIPVLAMFVTGAEETSVNRQLLKGTIQNDILKEFMVRNRYMYPPEHTTRIIGDIFAYTAKNMPRFN